MPNPCFDAHAEASAARDNVKKASKPQAEDNLLDLKISK